MSRQFLHFNLGPVQSFVAQARRTRDFWAGSFLLSWLSGVAMQTTAALGGRVIFPQTDGTFLGWIGGEGTGAPPVHGALPNRFLAEVDAGFDAKAVADSVQTAWESLAETVWTEDLASGVGEASRAIWQRQVGAFWQVTWVLTESPAETTVLDRRKNWRSQAAPPEPGIKCVVMDGWQELSGEASPDRPAAREFWQGVSASLGSAYDIREKEYLSAIAFIKRRFPYHFHKVSAVLPGGWTAQGWEVPVGLPSVSYMAAAHWLAGALEAAEEADLKRFLEAATRLGAVAGERNTRIPCIAASCRGRETHQQVACLDGDLFFASHLENERSFPDPALTAQAAQALRKLHGTSTPSPYYAVLAMDGDSLGRLMADGERQQAVSRSIATFAAKVPEAVCQANGFLIYAGGDDVLAILPMEDALGCATALQGLFAAAFRENDLAGTISGAVLYAHVKTPLTHVLQRSHWLLDECAKERCGRDSLAVEVLRHGGESLAWSAPWQKAKARAGLLAPEALAEVLAAHEQRAEGFSSGFLYRLRSLFDRIQPRGGDGPSLGEEDLTRLVLADYVDSLQGRGAGSNLPEKADLHREVEDLLSLCRSWRRVSTASDEATYEREKAYCADGALLARFLARKGAEA